MQKRLWNTDGLFVGAATLLTIGSTALAKPADLRAIAINGGTAGLGALGLVTWVRYRHHHSQTLLKRQLQADRREIAQYTREADEFDRALAALQQRLDQLEQGQTELTRVNLQLHQQWQQNSQALEHKVMDWQSHLDPERDRYEQAEPPAESATVAKPLKKIPILEPFASKQAEIVTQWLERRQIRVAPSLAPVEHVDNHYNYLALYLGDYYVALKDLHAAMKRSLAYADEKLRNRFWVECRSNYDFRIGTKFCEDLKRAFLVKGDFRPKPGKKFLRGELATAGDFRDFLNGKWFERFVYQKMAQILTDKGLDYACLLNAKVLSPNGQTAAELDMLFLIEGKPLCIECKSGNYEQKDAEKFAQYAGNLKLPKAYAIFVVLENHAADLELQKPRMGTITMTTSAQLVSALEVALQAIEAAVSEADDAAERAAAQLLAQSAMPIDTEVSTESGTESDTESGTKSDTESGAESGTEIVPSVLTLIQSRFRAIPQERMAVWQSLIALFADKPLPAASPPAILNFTILKNRLAAQIGLSKRQINGVLLLLRNAGYFWDDEGNPVMAMEQPIATLRSPDLAAAEQTFVEEYVKNVLKLDWHFFDEAAQCEQFAATVGAAVPDAVTLERLKQELSEDEAELS